MKRHTQHKGAKDGAHRPTLLRCSVIEGVTLRLYVERPGPGEKRPRRYTVEGASAAGVWAVAEVQKLEEAEAAYQRAVEAYGGDPTATTQKPSEGEE